MNYTAIGMLLLLCASPLSAGTALQDSVAALPAPAFWQAHLQHDLLPWWRQAAALGEPVGRFPTFRCNDGSRWRADQPCAELAQAPKWIREELGRDYVRMQSRQVFAYAMGFHMTGDAQLLAWARAGLADMRARALDARTGSPATYYQDGQPQPPVGERTAQDIAYAGLAFAAVYYLTHDAAVLADLDRLHRHLMSYYDVQRGQLRWTLAGPERERQELVAQLDPLNAYMVLITPLTRGERRARWQAALRRLATAIREQYCAGIGPRCQGTLGQPDSARPGARHNDFGHSGKALWMLGLVGRQLHDTDLQQWADQRARQLLQQAWMENSGSWASRWRDEGVEGSKQWWIYAELDQLATTLALTDASYAQYLRYSWPWWSRHLVDTRGHEVWGYVSAAGYAGAVLKQHQWKNGYHSVEHALVSYLGSAALKGEDATLYFAASAGKAGAVQPYFFNGRVLGRDTREGVTAVRFALPRPSLRGKAGFSVTAPQPPLPIQGQRRAVVTAMLPQLVGQWQGEWRIVPASPEHKAPATLYGSCSWTISRLSSDHVEAEVCSINPDATASAASSSTLAGPARISDGELHLPGAVLGSIIKAHVSELDQQLYLQWQQTVAGRNVTVLLRKVAP